MSDVLLLGEMLISFSDDSLVPTNETALKDPSNETCTTFQQSGLAGHFSCTHFRILAFAADVGSINVTITGSRLGCGRNLYVSPVSPAESESWLGHWKTCQFEATSDADNREKCSYWCSSPGHSQQIQVLNVPRDPDEFQWEVCQIDIVGNSPGEQINKRVCGACGGVIRFSSR